MIRPRRAATDLLNTVESSTLTIRYRSELLRALAHEALEAFLSFPPEGREIGGVLFGRRQQGEIQIQAARPVTCQYAKDPAGKLSIGDEGQLRQVLDEAARDPSLGGLNPVGYYGSQLRSGISDRDSRPGVLSLRFRESSYVALVLRPLPSGEVRAAFFECNVDAPGCHSSGLPEFTALPAPSFLPLESGSSTPLRPPAEVLAAPEAAPRRRQRFLWLIPLLFILLSTAGWLLQKWRLGRPHTPLQMRLEAQPDGRPVLRRDSKSKFLQRAESAELQVTSPEGEFRSALQPETLRTGSLTLASESGDIRARLRVYPVLPGQGQQPVEEATRYLAPSIQSNSAGLAPPDPRPLAPAREDQDTAAALLDEAPPAKPGRSAARSGTPSFTPFAPIESKPSAEPEVPPRPLFSNTGPAMARPDSLDLFPKPVAPPTNEAYDAPAARNGRLIWTGYLPATGTLTIDRGLVSIGSLTGALPGRPVRIQAYPAALSSEGITVYHGGGPSTRENAMEAPGPYNAWTRIQFVRDPSRASNLSVVEAPSSANGWVRLGLRAGAQPVSVVIIDWSGIE
jgi:hypothetical protein